jgi:hypothetical protein
MIPLWTERQDLIVEEDDAGRPLRFYWERRYHIVERVSRHWRVHLDWWTTHELWRDYWEVATDAGLLCVLYHDLPDGGWALERIYP